MQHKILTLTLLLALALLPVAQAMSPDAMPADHDHGTMVMDCGQVDPGQCFDFESCVSGSHGSCDVNAKAHQASPRPADLPGSHAYAAVLAERFPSHHSELLLRPPRDF